MGGVDVGGGGGKRKSVDSEINMIPMIDLLMVTISFLLISAVWTHMARINADAQVPGPPRPDVETTPAVPEKQLHVEMRNEDMFKLSWKTGASTVETIDVPRRSVVSGAGTGQEVVRFPDLAQKIDSEWHEKGQHRETSDLKIDQAIVHTDNQTEYKYIIGVIDAIYKPHRDVLLGGKPEKVPAFNVTFAVD